ncbi:peroxiredoxin [Luteithermobacter gelatinilyticus]|uniref:peroxiredoxin n=1 Tax=Luteithermobacter gelatinilyticus TaxID=2582913 RepID=UPI001105E28F|nr:peroxiredoxin [Luteithermobacter gelatinilyticus]|tara:strand:+ start:12184 stop:12666 length:483 start_codon:yes stop_codon:yes gene_type:complete
MTVSIGDKIPEATLIEMTADGPVKRTTSEIFGGRKVVLFSVPGAFTPTCSAKHLPGFVSHAAAFKEKGVDEIVCIAVNDAFVMGAWGKDQNAEGKVTLLADGNAEFTRALGLEMDASGYGMGLRGQRFAMIVEDGVIKQLNVEAPGEFRVSSAEHVLSQL